MLHLKRIISKSFRKSQREEYLEISSAPANEDCLQVGSPGYTGELAHFESEVYADQIKRTFGEPPEGARIRVKSFPHDFGRYYEVVVYYDESKEEAINYAFKVENDSPVNWDEAAKNKLSANPAYFEALHSSRTAKLKKVAPFKSPQQEAYLWAKEPEIAEKWVHEHGHAKGYKDYLKRRKKKSQQSSYWQVLIDKPDKTGQEYRLLHDIGLCDWDTCPVCDEEQPRGDLQKKKEEIKQVESQVTAEWDESKRFTVVNSYEEHGRIISDTEYDISLEDIELEFDYLSEGNLDLINQLEPGRTHEFGVGMELDSLTITRTDGEPKPPAKKEENIWINPPKLSIRKAQVPEGESMSKADEKALDPSTSEKKLRTLATSPMFTTRAFVAGNSSTPKDVLLSLTKDEDWVVRHKLAQNPSACEETLSILAKDPSLYVRGNVASNPSSSAEVLKLLINDENLTIRNKARHSLRFIE